MLPGTYLPPEQVSDPDALVGAALAWEPDAVVTGRVAAARQFWPELDHDIIDLAMPRQRSVGSPHFRIIRRTIPPGLIGRYSGARLTRPALTALDLCPELGGEVIDRVLRSRKVTPEQLRRALELTPQRAGNRRRRAETLDAAGNPWSWAERLTHRTLRDAGITGWRGNPKLLVRGQVYYPDILFPAVRLVVEVDGSQHWRDGEVYQNDLWRTNDFALERYPMLRYTCEDVERRPAMVVQEITEMVATLAREQRSR